MITSFIKLCTGGNTHPLSKIQKTKQNQKTLNPSKNHHQPTPRKISKSKAKNFPTNQSKEVKGWMLVSMLIPESTCSPRLALISSCVPALGTEGKALLVCAWALFPLPVRALQFKDAKFLEWQMMISEELRPICFERELGRVTSFLLVSRLSPCCPLKNSGNCLLSILFKNLFQQKQWLLWLLLLVISQWILKCKKNSWLQKPFPSAKFSHWLYWRPGIEN